MNLLRPSVDYFYHTDGLGSVTELTDAAGTTAQAYLYDAFGSFQSTDSLINPYAYTGRELDPESGLYYYRARYYDSNSGRFLSGDPIGFDEFDINLYRYVFNNPVNYFDPVGLIGFDVFGNTVDIKASFSFLAINIESRLRKQNTERVNCCIF